LRSGIQTIRPLANAHVRRPDPNTTVADACLTDLREHPKSHGSIALAARDNIARGIRADWPRGNPRSRGERPGSTVAHALSGCIDGNRRLISRPKTACRDGRSGNGMWGRRDGQHHRHPRTSGSTLRRA
jgi:hypothetical protein